MNKDNLIEFAKEQCEIFPEDSAMGWYLRETLKMLQAEPCEDISIILEGLPPVTPTRKKGKWIIDDKENNRIWHCHCSECKKDPQNHVGGSENWWLVRLPKYCPYCGSLMEVEE